MTDWIPKKDDYCYFVAMVPDCIYMIINSQPRFSDSTGDHYEVLSLLKKKPGCICHYNKSSSAQINRCYPTFVGFKE